MEQLVSLELLAEQTIANSLMEKGLAEVVLRRSDQKFRSFIKCQVVGPGNSSEVPVDEIIEKMADSLSGKKGKKLFGAFHKTHIGQYVPYLNAILAVVEIAVDAEGNRQLSQLIVEQSVEIQKLSEKIDKISNAQKNEKIGTFLNLVMQFNSMQDKLQYNEIIDLDALDGLIRDIRTFITEMMNNWIENSISRDVALQIILTLLPAYTYLLCEYVKSFYFQKQRIPPNYEMMLSLYDELEKHGFDDHILDYYILDKKIPTLATKEILDSKRILLGQKGRRLVEDELLLVKNLETPEKYSKFDSELNQVAQKQAKQLAVESC